LVDINIDNIETIDTHVFAGTGSITLKLQLDKLPSGLKGTIGDNAFFNAGPGVAFTEIPAGVDKIGSYAFALCDNVKITNFGSNDNSSILRYIDDSAF
jgi:hypothetical protein